jgi:D-alanyl-D-alanine endopeptidase (penicillin-binding protein 7)
VFDEAQKMVLYSKQAADVAPIASITKLVTAMVVLDAHLPPDEWIAIEKSDVDQPKRTRSRLMVGARLRRDDLLRIALMASDNRAAAALARSYPGGAPACIAAMNAKAQELGMLHSRFIDASGLSSENQSTAVDLARLVQAAGRYPEIRDATTSWSHSATLGNGRVLEFHNSNGLVSNKTWTIGLSKTGYINEAGRCLVMQAEIAARPVIIVLLDSWGKYTRLGDANRIRHWMESIYKQPAGAVVHSGGGPTGVPSGS